MEFKSFTNLKDLEKLTLHEARWITCWKFCVHCRCHRVDLIRMMGFNHIHVKRRVESRCFNFSPFRLLLFELIEEMETADLKTALCNLSSVIPRSEHYKIKSVCDVFIQLEISGDLNPANIEVLYKLLKMMDPRDLISKVRTYQGAQPTGWNTELGYGPVEEGHIPRTIESMEPEYQGEGQIPPANTVEQQRPGQATPANTMEQQRLSKATSANTVEQQRPSQDTEHSVQFTGNRLPLHLGQFQSVIPNQQEIGDIRVVPSLQENPVFWGFKQEQPSPGTNPSVRGVGNQTPTEPSPCHKTGLSSEVSVNLLVPCKDIITEEQFLGDSEVTAGIVSLSDSCSQDINLGEAQLSINESKLVGLSEVIARRDDCFLLASALMINYDQTSQIMQANPTNELIVHGFLKHWFIEQRNTLGTSPSADGLLKAFELLGFNDAIEEYVRLSLEPDSELEQGSENLAARSEPIEIEDFNVLSGLNPQSNRQLYSHDDVIVGLMEVPAIEDSVMPFYKMNARPRGLAIIINNKHFHKIKNDQSSKQMPTRPGTEKDAEKLDYIWRRLDFEVRLFNDVDSTRMAQIMVETAFEDHSRYDCLVVTILTHGILGHVYGADGRIVRISQLTSCVSGRTCQSLAGKPKLFFIQACQGREKQEGHEIETDASGSCPDNTQDFIVERPRDIIPDEADFLLGYATVPGYVSYRSRSKGSWYINKLVQNLDKYAYQYDLLNILIKVNEEVGKADNGAYKQIPAPMFTLRKRIIFR